MLTAGTTATIVAFLFFEALDGLHRYIVICSYLQLTLFVSKFLDTLFTQFVIKHITTTAYPQQTNKQLKTYSKTTKALLRHYFSIQNRDWDFFV